MWELASIQYVFTESINDEFNTVSKEIKEFITRHRAHSQTTNMTDSSKFILPQIIYHKVYL